MIYLGGVEEKNRLYIGSLVSFGTESHVLTLLGGCEIGGFIRTTCAEKVKQTDGIKSS